MGKTLVAYFSAGGVTKKKAELLSAETGADLYEIRPEIPYTKADLNWMNKNSRSSVEMADRTSRPALSDRDAKIEAYDTVLLGFPIWWYTAPRISQTFLESYNFQGKKIILFATSGSNGFGDTAKDLSPSAPGAQIIEGKVIRKTGLDKSLKEIIALI